MTTLTEPAGWGEPGTVRHAEEIGHTVWLEEHPDDALSTDELIARSQAARADLDATLTNVRKHFGTEAMCPIPDCIRVDHPLFEMCEDAVGHTWFQGDEQRDVARWLSEGPDLPGGIQP